MPTNRLEAFSDGVLAIIITIMVLELRAPEEASFRALRPLLPLACSYLLSFIYLGIYWNNHHHMFQATERISGTTLWTNLHLLFWLSLFPFVTDWVGGNLARETARRLLWRGQRKAFAPSFMPPPLARPFSCRRSPSLFTSRTRCPG